MTVTGGHGRSSAGPERRIVPPVRAVAAGAEEARAPYASGVDVRRARDDDLAAIAEIALANGELEGADPRYVTHLRRHGRFLVAETDGAVAGYCATRRVCRATMLCDLFVAPDRHGGGVGGLLLDAAFAEPGPRFTFASQDPRAMPLYIRHGMIPRWPLLYLSGAPSGPAPLRFREVPAAVAGLAELRLGGADRTADYAYWASLGGTGVIVRDGGDDVAAGAVVPGWLAHLATAAECDPVPALLTALAAAGGEAVRLCLPGPHPAVPSLLEARWRIDGHDHHMASEDGLLPVGGVMSPSLA